MKNDLSFAGVIKTAQDAGIVERYEFFRRILALLQRNRMPEPMRYSSKIMGGDWE